ncbi:MAG: mannose-1-phosphate guanyltransferase [Chloroflexi bacterium]|nr:mannose-1-phosphate guanyltransferase [Chloroflexota bacterium]
MKAVVMAGGQGTRLRPLTMGRPKPLVPIVNRPVLSHILGLVKRHGITEVVITLQHMAAALQEYVGDGEEFGLHINYSLEQTPLGTAGSVFNARERLDGTFLVISGDALTDFDLTSIIEFHRQKHALATITLYRVSNPLDYGAVIIDPQGRIQKFLEKPSWGEVISDTVNTGIYILEPEALHELEEGKATDFSRDLFPLLLSKGALLYGYVANGYWRDIGNLEEYRQACFDLLEGRVNLEEIGQPLRPGVWSGGEVEIAPDAQLTPPLYLGGGAKVKGGAVLHGPVVVGENTIIDAHAQVERSIIWRDSYLGEGAELHGAIVGSQVSMKRRAVAFEGVVIGDFSIVGEGAMLHSQVKIWPEKEIESGAIVRQSIIWGSQGRRVLFGRFGVTGLVNVDLTPEFAARLGAAFGSTLQVGSTVTMNRDPHRSPRMIKRAMISGLPSVGTHVSDLGNMPIPVARYITAQSGAGGGVHVRLSPFDQRVVDIKFFDEQGLNLSKAKEKEIERVFFREEFRRVYLEEVGTIAYAPQVVERYTQGFLRVVDTPAIQRRGFRLVVDYAHAPTSLVLPIILNHLNCSVVAINARLDETKMSLLPEEFQEGINQLALIVSAVKSDLGARLDVGGEKIFLVDDRGEILPSLIATLALGLLSLRAHPGGTLVIPAHLPRAFEKLAKENGGRIIRSGVDPQAIIATARQEGAVLAADGTGHFAFPTFHPGFDGMIALASLLEFLATQGIKLSEVVAILPAYHLAERRVPCPWEFKGTVLRRLHEEYRQQEVPAGDGVHIQLGEDWVLVRPDPDEPIIHVHAEAGSEVGAQELAQKYSGIVEALQE